MAAAIYLGTCERGYRSVVAVADDPSKCITHSLFLIYYKPTNPHFYTTKVQLPKYRYRVLESTRYNY